MFVCVCVKCLRLFASCLYTSRVYVFFCSILAVFVVFVRPDCVLLCVRFCSFAVCGGRVCCLCLSGVCVCVAVCYVNCIISSGRQLHGNVRVAPFLPP